MQALVTSDEVSLVPETSPPEFKGFIQKVDEPEEIRNRNRLVRPTEPTPPPIKENPIEPIDTDSQGITLKLTRPTSPSRVEEKFKIGLMDGEQVPIVRVRPTYPRRAFENNIEGWVLLEFGVDIYGSIVRPRVLDAEPIGYFERTSLKAIKKFKYMPAVIDGQTHPSKALRYRMSYNIGN